MTKIISYAILSFFYLTSILGCGALYSLADNDKYGLLAIPIFLFVFLGYYFILKIFPNDSLRNIADYGVFIRSVFIIMAVMGCLLTISFIQNSKHYGLAFEGRAYRIGTSSSVIKTLHIVVIIILIAPFIIQRIFFPKPKIIIVEEDENGNVTFK